MDVAVAVQMFSFGRVSEKKLSSALRIIIISPTKFFSFGSQFEYLPLPTGARMNSLGDLADCEWQQTERLDERKGRLGGIMVQSCFNLLPHSCCEHSDATTSSPLESPLVCQSDATWVILHPAILRQKSWFAEATGDCALFGSPSRADCCENKPKLARKRNLWPLICITLKQAAQASWEISSGDEEIARSEQSSRPRNSIFIGLLS